MSDKDITENAETAEETEDQEAAAEETAETAAPAEDAPEETPAAEAAPEEDAGDGEEDEFTFEEDPTFEVDHKGECLYEVKVTIPVSNEQKQMGDLFEELQGEAEVPGFRKGRAPRKLIEKKFGKVVRGDATEKLVGAAFRKLVKDEDLRPISMPDIEGMEEMLERAAGEPISCNFKFEVAPRCELGPYRGIEVERPVLKVEEADVEDAIKEMRERFAMFETEEGAKAEEGDQLIIDFTGTIDGEEFPGGKAENYPYILGSKRFFMEFEAALAGAEGGQELTCVVPFPEDYSSPDLAGKKADFSIKVSEIKRRKLPELDDDFAKQAGEEGIDALRKRVEADLGKTASAQCTSMAESNALKTIVAASTFELPKSLVESSAEEYYNQEVQRLMSMHMPVSEIEKQEEEIRKRAEETALSGIKGFVVVNEIGSAEGIEVTEEDFEKEAMAIRDRTGMEMDVISRFLGQQEQRDEYENRIYREKSMAVVMDNAKLVDKEVQRQELEESDEPAES